MMAPRDGIALGRFQPFHLGHLEYIETARSQCRRLFIGLTNPDPHALIEVSSDPARSQAQNNPFTFAARRAMIEAALWDLGWDDQDFCIVPAPLMPPERLVHYLPEPTQASALLTIYDAWGEQKAQLMAELGYSVTVLWRRDHASRVTSGTEIRDRISRHRPWQHLVPAAVIPYVEAELVRAS